jgi:hypothetical protein
MRVIHLSKIFTIIIGIIVIGYFIFIRDGVRYNYSVLFTSFLISSISFIKALQLDNRPYSLNKIFYIFFLFFIGIAPAMQFKYQTSFWGANYLGSNEYFLMNILFIVILITYSILYTYFINKKKNYLLKSLFSESSKKIVVKKSNLRIVLISISIISTFLFSYFNNFNLVLMFFRGSIDTTEISGFQLQQSQSLMLSMFIRPIPLVSLFIYKVINKKIDFIEVVLIILVLISNLPTGMPRFMAAALYIPLALIYIPKLQKGFNFTLLNSFGVLIVFPILNIFRRFDVFHFNREIFSHMFLTADFDSYHNFWVAISNKCTTWGTQLVGVLLFFVPREIWPSKPIGSGHFLAEKLNLSFSNISMNYFGEGYMNFGFIGIFIFTILLSYINASLDQLYWKDNKSAYLNICYPFMIGMLFFALRGDLMSSFAYSVGLLLSIYFVLKLITKRSDLA